VAAAKRSSRGARRSEVNSGDPHETAHAFYQHMGYQFDDRRFIKEDERLSADGSQTATG